MYNFSLQKCAREMLLRLLLYCIGGALASFLRVETGHRNIQIEGRDPYPGHFTKVTFTEQTCIRAVSIHCLVPLTGAEEIDLLYSPCENEQWRVAHYNNKEARFFLKASTNRRQAAERGLAAPSVCGGSATPRRHRRHRAPFPLRAQETGPVKKRTKRAADQTPDKIYSLSDSPYRIDENITVARGQRFDVEPGVRITFAPNTGILVYGTLYIKGSLEQPVYLEAAEAGSWLGVIVSSTEAPSSFTYLNVSGSIYGITIRDSPSFPTFDHVIADSNRNGFTFETSKTPATDDTPLRVFKASAVHSAENGFNVVGETPILLDACLAASNRLHGIYVERVSSIALLNSHVFSNDGDGIVFNTTQAVSIANTLIGANGQHGIRVQSGKHSAQAEFNLLGVNITNHATHPAIRLDACENAEIYLNSCHIYDNHDGVLVIDGRSDTCEIKLYRGNFTRNRGPALHLETLTHGTVHLEQNTFASNHMNARADREALVNSNCEVTSGPSRKPSLDDIRLNHWALGSEKEILLRICAISADANSAALYLPFANYTGGLLIQDNQPIPPFTHLYNTIPNNGRAYVVSENMTIPEDKVVIIEPGVQIRFLKDAKLIVLGKLYANGSASTPIKLGGSQEGAQWPGIRLAPKPVVDLGGTTVTGAQTIGLYVEERGKGVKISNLKIEQSDGFGVDFEKPMGNVTLENITCGAVPSNLRIIGANFVENTAQPLKLDLGECAGAQLLANSVERNSAGPDDALLKIAISPKIDDNPISKVAIFANKFNGNTASRSTLELSNGSGKRFNGTLYGNTFTGNANNEAVLEVDSNSYRISGNEFRDPQTPFEVLFTGAGQLHLGDNVWGTQTIEAIKQKISCSEERRVCDDGQISVIPPRAVPVDPATIHTLPEGTETACPGDCGGHEICPQLKNCSGHGYCTSSDICKCEEGFAGNDCSVELCSTRNCEHGFCEAGICKCEPGWTGKHCSLGLCANECSYSGICVGPAQCKCFADYTGTKCEKCATKECVGCEPDCKHGVCDAESGTCRCTNGWSGAACDVCATNSCPTDPSISYILPQTADVGQGNGIVSVYGQDLPSDATYRCLYGTSTAPGKYINSHLVRCSLPEGSSEAYQVKLDVLTPAKSEAIDWEIGVPPSYQATVEGTEVVGNTQKRRIYGRIDKPLANRPVAVRIRRQDADLGVEEYTVMTGESGRFSFEYTPQYGGVYAVAAHHPGVKVDDWSNGVELSWSNPSVKVTYHDRPSIEELKQGLEFEVQNTGDGVLSGWQIPPSIAPREAARIIAKFDVEDGFSGPITLILVADGGFSYVIRLEVTTKKAKGILTAIPESLVVPLVYNALPTIQVRLDTSGTTFYSPIELGYDTRPSPFYLIGSDPPLNDYAEYSNNVSGLSLTLGASPSGNKQNGTIRIVYRTDTILRIPYTFSRRETELFNLAICLKDENFLNTVSAAANAQIDLVNSLSKAVMNPRGAVVNGPPQIFTLYPGYYQLTIYSDSHQKYEEPILIGTSELELYADGPASKDTFVILDAFEDDNIKLEPPKSALVMGGSTRAELAVKRSSSLFGNSAKCDAILLQIPYRVARNGSREIGLEAQLILAKTEKPKVLCDVASKTIVRCNCAAAVRRECREKYESPVACGQGWAKIADDTTSLENLAMIFHLIAECQQVQVHFEDLLTSVSEQNDPSSDAIDAQAISYAAHFMQFLQNLESIVPFDQLRAISAQEWNKFFKAISDSSAGGPAIWETEKLELGQKGSAVENLAATWNNSVTEWTAGKIVPFEALPNPTVIYDQVHQVVSSADKLKALSRQAGAPNPFALLHAYFGKLAMGTEKSEDACAEAFVLVEPDTVVENAMVTLRVQFRNLRRTSLTGVNLKIEWIRADAYTPEVKFATGIFSYTGIFALDGTQSLPAGTSFRATAKYTTAPVLPLKRDVFYQPIVVISFENEGTRTIQKLETPDLKITPKPNIQVYYLLKSNGDDSKLFNITAIFANKGYVPLDNVKVINTALEILGPNLGPVGYRIEGLTVDGTQRNGALSYELGTIRPGATKTAAYQMSALDVGKLSSIRAQVLAGGKLLPLDDNKAFTVKQLLNKGLLISPLDTPQPEFFFDTATADVTNLIHLQNIKTTSTDSTADGRPYKHILAVFSNPESTAFSGSLLGKVQLPAMPSTFRLIRLTEVDAKLSTTQRNLNGARWTEAEGNSLNFIDKEATLPLPLNTISYEAIFGDPAQFDEPVFEKGSYRIQVLPESWPTSGSKIGSVAAYSPDGSPLEYALYSRTGDATYAIDSQTGEIYAERLPAENQDRCLIVEAKTKNGKIERVPLTINTGGSQKGCVAIDTSELKPLLHSENENPGAPTESPWKTTGTWTTVTTSKTTQTAVTAPTTEATTSKGDDTDWSTYSITPDTDLPEMSTTETAETTTEEWPETIVTGPDQELSTISYTSTDYPDTPEATAETTETSEAVTWPTIPVSPDSTPEIVTLTTERTTETDSEPTEVTTESEAQSTQESAQTTLEPPEPTTENFYSVFPDSTPATLETESTLSTSEAETTMEPEKTTFKEIEIFPEPPLFPDGDDESDPTTGKPSQFTTGLPLPGLTTTLAPDDYVGQACARRSQAIWALICDLGQLSKDHKANPIV
ncbi:unnamed protein product, partial [Mesorhabditis spiculigera]